MANPTKEYFDKKFEGTMDEEELEETKARVEKLERNYEKIKEALHLGA